MNATCSKATIAAKSGDHALLAWLRAAAGATIPADGTGGFSRRSRENYRPEQGANRERRALSHNGAQSAVRPRDPCASRRASRGPLDPHPGDDQPTTRTEPTLGGRTEIPPLRSQAFLDLENEHLGVDRLSFPLAAVPVQSEYMIAGRGDRLEFGAHRAFGFLSEPAKELQDRLNASIVSGQ